MFPSSFQSCSLKLEVKDNHFALFPAHKFYWHQICSARETTLKKILFPDKWGTSSSFRGITVSHRILCASHERQFSTNLSHQCGSLLQTAILLVTDCSTMDFPHSHRFLWDQSTAPLWGPPRAAGGTLPHGCSPRAARAQPAMSPQAKGERLLPCALPPASSVAYVFAWLSLSYYSPK